MRDQNLETPSDYQVLARKYRPATFSDLVGQDLMVRILKNSFLSERIAHAFMLTGVRGVGKTTTARIVAKGLNCVGLDGDGGPTITPCRKCENCISIAKGNHVDVLEIDAASRTGVADIREIIDSVSYRAASARFKIYIIDEVHMLSTSAFNALLKTLEEPPKHVKFIFATTEIQKVPTTVLSRCQRFDLKRIEPKEMIKYLNAVCRDEGFDIEEDCLGQITRASEGSMRDALSLLEQLFVDAEGEVDLTTVRSMLGLSDRGLLLDLFERLVEADIVRTLEQFNIIYEDGADPVEVIKELCEVTHWITILKISPHLANDVTVSPDERSRGLGLVEKMSIRELARLWQLLLKVLDETSTSLNSKVVAEMGLIRVAYTSDLPTPDELIKKFTKNSDEIEASETKSDISRSNTPNSSKAKNLTVSISKPSRAAVMDNNLKLSYPEQGEAETDVVNSLNNFQNVIELIRVNRDVELLIEVEDNLRLVNYQLGQIEFEPTENASTNLASRLTTFLKASTGQRWIVSVVSSGGGETIGETRLKRKIKLEQESMKNPIVSAVFDIFPNAKIDSILEKNTFLSEKPKIDNKDYEWNPLEEE
jgi:DNA polymerase-3 subunit gamma/tau